MNETIDYIIHVGDSFPAIHLFYIFWMLFDFKMQKKGNDFVIFRLVKFVQSEGRNISWSTVLLRFILFHFLFVRYCCCCFISFVQKKKKNRFNFSEMHTNNSIRYYGSHFADIVNHGYKLYTFANFTFHSTKWFRVCFFFVRYLSFLLFSLYSTWATSKWMKIVWINYKTVTAIKFSFSFLCSHFTWGKNIAIPIVWIDKRKKWVKKNYSPPLNSWLAWTCID